MARYDHEGNTISGEPEWAIGLTEDEYNILTDLTWNIGGTAALNLYDKLTACYDTAFSKGVFGQEPTADKPKDGD